MNTKRSMVARGALMVWAALLLMVCAYLLASHLVALPTPSRDNPGLVAALNANRTPQERDRWLMVHVLYGACPCSRRIAAHLQTRPLVTDTRERLLLVGEDKDLADAVADRGFSVEQLTAEALGQRYHIEGVPLLVIADPAGRVRYVGGYTDRKQGPDIRDLDILRDLQNDRSIQALPLFGCAVSRKLRDALNPIEGLLP